MSSNTVFTGVGAEGQGLEGKPGTRAEEAASLSRVVLTTKPSFRTTSVLHLFIDGRNLRNLLWGHWGMKVEA
jgi:hypothetical protein